METKREINLPENAYRELRPGETYLPIVPAAERIAEATARSFLIGIVLNIVFSMSAAYIALKLGQGIETAIPVAILAVGISAALRRRSTLLENVNVMAVGATSGIIVGGAVFTLPALFILGIDYLSSLFQLFFVAFFGAVLGVLFLIPFRRYFVEDMHGKLPFPEGTATTEILVAGERGGRQARLLAIAMVAGGVFDFLVISLRLWRENFTTALIAPCDALTNKVKLVFSMNTSAAIAGLGYIIGIRYAAIIFAGSMLSWFVLVPLFAHWGQGAGPAAASGAAGLQAAASAAGALSASASAEDIFYDSARYIGIGAIFVAGLIGILKLSPVIAQAMKSGFRELAASRKAHAGETSAARTDRDISMSVVAVLFVATVALLWLYFRFSVLRGLPSAWGLSLIALAVTVVISFLFASVSARAVAMIGVTPISGMTLMTLVVASIIMIRAGLTGPQGMLAALLIGGVVCTALSTTATLVTEFKIGYWLGATPRKIQLANFAGSAVAAVVVALVIMLLNKVYGFAPGPTHPTPLPAPQPNAMAAVIKSLMASAEAPWFLYAIGGVIAIIVETLGISGLAFALGMYIPIELNAPILAGAVVAWFVRRKTHESGESQQDRGTLIASGLIAGGALMGVISSLIKWIEAQSGKTILPDFNNTGPAGNVIGLVLFIALCVGVYFFSIRRRSTA